MRFPSLPTASPLVLLALLLRCDAQETNSTEMPPLRNCSVFVISETTLLWTVAHHFGKVHGHLSAGVCVFGLLANLANVIVLTRKDLASSSTNRILMWLALADLLMFIVYFPQVVHFNMLRPPDTPYLHTSSWAWIKFSEFVVSFTLICHAAAVWLTVLLALFRYLYIAFPTRGPTMASLGNAHRGSILVILVSVALSVPNIVMNEVDSCQHVSGNGSSQVMFEIVMSAEYPRLRKVNFWLQALIQKIIPSVCLTVFTILLIIEMHKAATRRAALKGRGGEKHSSARENRTTLMLLTIVLLFLITVMPNGVLLCLAEMNDHIMQFVYQPLGDFLDLFALINESINFILYTTMSQQFRMTFCKTFCPTCITERRQWAPGAKPSTKLAAPKSAHNGGKTAEATCLVGDRSADAKACLVVHSNFDGSSGELSSTV